MDAANIQLKMFCPAPLILLVKDFGWEDANRATHWTNFKQCMASLRDTWGKIGVGNTVFQYIEPPKLLTNLKIWCSFQCPFFHSSSWQNINSNLLHKPKAFYSIYMYFFFYRIVLCAWWFFFQDSQKGKEEEKQLFLSFTSGQHVSHSDMGYIILHNNLQIYFHCATLSSLWYASRNSCWLWFCLTHEMMCETYRRYRTEHVIWPYQGSQSKCLYVC